MHFVAGSVFPSWHVRSRHHRLPAQVGEVPGSPVCRGISARRENKMKKEKTGSCSATPWKNTLNNFTFHEPVTSAKNKQTMLSKKSVYSVFKHNLDDMHSCGFISEVLIGKHFLEHELTHPPISFLYQSKWNVLKFQSRRN